MKRNAFIIAAALFFTGCAGIQPATPEVAASLECEAYPSNYKQMIRSYFSATLYDPMSAQYSFSEPAKAAYKDGCGWYIAMEVNAKNRMGGYVGAQYRQFIIYGGKLEEINTFQSGMINSQ